MGKVKIGKKLGFMGDARLDRRSDFITGRAAANPSLSFPKMFGHSADLEGTYRFLSNPNVTPESILAPHFAETARQCVEQGEVLVIHDTTAFEFGGESPRAGLGRLRSKGQGFFAHLSLASTSDGKRCPIGVLGLHTWVRTDGRKARHRKRQRNTRFDQESEGLRWGRQVELTEVRIRETSGGDYVGLIHVMDREGDAYGVIEQLVAGKRRFVIRVAHDRVLVPGESSSPVRLYQALSGIVPIVGRTAKLSRRKQAANQAMASLYPAREQRLARLDVSARAVTIRRTEYVDPSRSPSVKVFALEVREVEPPDGVVPVIWRLLTTEPVDTAEQVLRIVDYYRARWLIEEYFKALKTGCSIEKRQLESLPALLNCLAVFIPIARQLLAMRSLANENPDAPARGILTSSQIEVLRAVGTVPIPDEPTVADVFLAIAKMGGHIKWNGPPGWQVIWRGFEDLLLLELGWLAARSEIR